MALAVGLPTDVIANPVFGRPVPVTWWSYPALVVTSVLGGMLIATYVRPSARPAPGLEAFADGGGRDAGVSDERDTDDERHAKTGGLAGMLSFFAVGCPVCNKIVVLALGTAGARQWFEPFQPILAAFSLLLLGYALSARLDSARVCPVPPGAMPSPDS